MSLAGRLKAWAYRPPWGALTARWRPRTVVLLYHRIGAAAADPFRLAVPGERFADHLDALAARFPVISLTAALAGMDERRLPDGAVAVTFDDGYVDNLETAWPLARERSVPITVFVASGHLDAPAFPWPGGGRPLRREELRRLADEPGITIGAHGVGHRRLADLPAEERRRELAASRRELAELVQRPVDLLAYPFGKAADVGGDTPALAAAVGFRAAFTSIPGRWVPSSPRHLVPRVSVHAEPAAALVARVERLFDPPPPPLRRRTGSAAAMRERASRNAAG